DPRTQGSGKTGATNILRTLGPGPAVLVAVLDVNKGLLAVLLAHFVIYPLPAPPPPALAQHNLQATAAALTWLPEILGHHFSILLHAAGARGSDSGGGATLGMSPIAMLSGAVAMIIPIALTRYVSLGSIIGCAVVGVVALVLALTGHDYLPHTVFALAGAGLI